MRERVKETRKERKENSAERQLTREGRPAGFRRNWKKVKQARIQGKKRKEGRNVE